MFISVCKWLRSCWENIIKESKFGPIAITSIVSLVIAWIVGIMLAPATFDHPDLIPGQSYLIMCCILFIITFLSYFPILIYLGFSRRQKNQALAQTINELKHYKLNSYINRVKTNFRFAYSEPNYSIPLIIVTLSLFAGWVIFFFHEGPDVIESIGIQGEHDINSFLTRIANAHVALFGFLGAYAYTLGILYHRYVTRDLRPAVFIHIGFRIWTAIILALILDALFKDRAWIISLSFIAGIFPDFALDAIKNVARVKTAGFLNLSLIRGISIWNQARLSEEDIDSAQNLATSDLVGLIINTRFGVLRLVHWVDQAILLMHIGKEYKESFHKAGVITATDYYQNYFSVDKVPSEKEAMEIHVERKLMEEIPKPPQELVKALQQTIKEDKIPISEEQMRTILIAIISDYNFFRLTQFYNNITSITR